MAKVKLGRERKTMSVIRLADALSDATGKTRAECREFLDALSIVVAINLHRYDSVVVIPKVIKIDRYCKAPAGYGHTNESLKWAKRNLSLSPKITPEFLRDFVNTAEIIEPGDYPMTTKNLGPLKSLTKEEVAKLVLSRQKSAIRNIMKAQNISKEDALNWIMREDEGDKIWDDIRRESPNAMR